MEDADEPNAGTKGRPMKKQLADGSVRVEIASDPKEAIRLERSIVRQLRNTSFDGREIFGIKLAIEEALVNAIRHGNGLDPAKKVCVEYRVAPERIDIRIRDEGTGYDPVPRPRLQGRREPRAARRPRAASHEALHDRGRHPAARQRARHVEGSRQRLLAQVTHRR